MDFSSYIGIFKMQFKSEMQYRGKALSGIITQFFWGIMYIYLYKAFMKGGIEGFSLSQMATYIWLGQAFFVMKCIHLNKRVPVEITDGNICYRFSRPLNVYSQWFAETLGQRCASSLLRSIPIIIVTIFLPAGLGLSAPASFIAFVLFVLSLSIGMLMANIFSMFSFNLVFLTMSQKSAVLVNTFVGLFNGAYVPIPMLPNAMQNVLKWLPFGYISDLPFRIYCGNVDPKTAVFRILLGLIWLVVLVLFGQLITKKQLKNVVVQGG